MSFRVKKKNVAAPFRLLAVIALFAGLDLLPRPTSSFSPPSRQLVLFARKSRTDTATMNAHSAQRSRAGSLFSTNNAKEDSLDEFERDLAIVLNDLRSEAHDPTLPRLFQTKAALSLPTFTSIFTLDDWERHASRRRYWDYVRTFPMSRLAHRCAPQLSVLTIWSILACWIVDRKVPVLCNIALPMTPLSLLSGFVAALTSLRTSQTLSRLGEGRTAFGKVVLYTRDMAQLIASSIYPKDRMLGLKLLRHVSLYGWLLKNFLRGDKRNGNDEDIIRVMLRPADAAYVLRQRKRPSAVIARLRQVFTHMAEEGKLSTAEELALDHTTQALNGALTTTERIQASPFPRLYTAHTSRLLTFYLFFLPLALRGGGVLGDVATVFTTAAVGYTMLGLDEISHLIEQPFHLMPLWQLCKNSMKDVGDAVVCLPPKLDAIEDEDAPDGYTPPLYW
uniref:Bestrophin homolog n=1 Tax=Odontella aurita TaxID=265563 RepID=A0A7S4JU60_9STRA|mmetsp:Transcript_5400/g.15753  ORF Transcript_5400/g.15753 Transcript_5400/m.15753 type:complete len:448 (+) Transcript_5400:147-1490(+)